MAPGSGSRDKAQSGYADRIVARAREIRNSDAFEPASGKMTAEDYRRIKEELRISSKRNRIMVAGLLVAMVAVLLFSMLLPFTDIEYIGPDSGKIYDPGAVLACWQTWLHLHVGVLFDSTISTYEKSTLDALAAAYPDVSYNAVVGRGAACLAIIACGCLLAVSGMLFQTAFRNPLATPTMLGISDGVTLGIIVFVALGNTGMSANPMLYVLLVYGFGVLVLVFVLLSSRFIAGGATYNVFDMLLIGTVVTQILSGINNYVSNFGFDQEHWDMLYDVQQGYEALHEPITYVLVAVFFLVTIVPVVVLRFRFNLLSFEDAEARLSGVRPGVLRAIALILGSTMQLAAIASVGQVAMLSLVVPFLVRYLLPSDTRYQIVGNVLLGSAILLACFAAQHFIYIGIVPMSIGTVVGVLVVPVFVWIVALQRRGWE